MLADKSLQNINHPTKHLMYSTCDSETIKFYIQIPEEVFTKHLINFQYIGP